MLASPCMAQRFRGRKQGEWEVFGSAGMQRCCLECHRFPREKAIGGIKKWSQSFRQVIPMRCSLSQRWAALSAYACHGWAFVHLGVAFFFFKLRRVISMRLRCCISCLQLINGPLRRKETKIRRDLEIILCKTRAWKPQEWKTIFKNKIACHQLCTTKIFKGIDRWERQDK